jgi:hypothetical protein
MYVTTKEEVHGNPESGRPPKGWSTVGPFLSNTRDMENKSIATQHRSGTDTVGCCVS